MARAINRNNRACLEDKQALRHQPKQVCFLRQILKIRARHLSSEALVNLNKPNPSSKQVSSAALPNRKPGPPYSLNPLSNLKPQPKQAFSVASPNQPNLSRAFSQASLPRAACSRTSQPSQASCSQWARLLLHTLYKACPIRERRTTSIRLISSI